MEGSREIRIADSVRLPEGQLFAWPGDGPRTRRTADIVMAVASGVAFLLAGWASHSGIAIDARVVETFDELPNWLSVVGRAAFFIGGVYAAGLVTLCLLRSAGRALARDLIVALSVMLGIALVSGHLVSGAWPNLFPEFVEAIDDVTFPVFRLAVLSVVVRTPGPHLTAPIRRLGDRVLATTALGGVLIGAVNVTGALGGLALGFGVAALVHLIFGTPQGLPAPERIRAALAQLGVGVGVGEVRLPDRQPVGAALAHAVDDNGQPLLVTVHGRDSAEAEWANKAWRALWYRHAGPTLSLSGMQQAEHEAVALLVAERADVNVPHMVAVGQDPNGNAYLVTHRPSEVPLEEIPFDRLDDEVLGQAWAAIGELHAMGMSHGSIDPRTILVGEEQVVLRDLSAAELSAGDSQINIDRVCLVATLATAVGIDRAAHSMIAALDVATIEESLRYMNESALDPELRRSFGSVGKLSAIASLIVDETEAAEPAQAKLRRVRLSDVVIIVFAIFAANAIIKQVAEIGFDTLLDELAGASLGWLLVAFVIKLSTAYSDVLSLRGAVTVPIPPGPTMMLQTAKSFVGLTVPTMAGRVAMDVRFLQQLGVSTSTALAQGPIVSFAGLVVEVVLLFAASWRTGSEFEIELLSGNTLGLLVVGVITLAVISRVVLALLPKVRAVVMPPIREAISAVSEVVHTPRRLGRIVGGELLNRILVALSLAATLAAFGQDLPFSAVVFVSVGVGLLAGIAPVPGGVGVAESLLTALLVGVGVPSETAFSVAITHRLVTSYLPPVLGFFTFRWLKQEGYL